MDECLYCPNVPLNKGLCTECNINYYPKENDPLNLGKYIKCYKEPEGYYLDINLYKRCYYTCKTCNIQGNYLNHNCIKCNANYPFIIRNNNYINCNEKCSYYHYFDSNNNSFCTIDLSCPNEFPKLIIDKLECIKEIEKMSKEEEIEYYDNLINTIERKFIENYNTSKLENGMDEYFTTKKMIITLTTLENQKNNINNNMTKLDLGECETLLRKEYNIANSEKLYTKKIDIAQEGMKIPKIEYDVYYQY